MRIEHLGPIASPTSLEQHYRSVVTEFAPRYWSAGSTETWQDYDGKERDNADAVRHIHRQLTDESVRDKVLRDYAFEVPGPDEVRA